MNATRILLYLEKSKVARLLVVGHAHVSPQVGVKQVEVAALRVLERQDDKAVLLLRVAKDKAAHWVHGCHLQHATGLRGQGWRGGTFFVVQSKGQAFSGGVYGKLPSASSQC